MKITHELLICLKALGYFAFLKAAAQAQMPLNILKASIRRPIHQRADGTSRNGDSGSLDK
jgi:hypothetical protein